MSPRVGIAAEKSRRLSEADRWPVVAVKRYGLVMIGALMVFA